MGNICSSQDEAKQFQKEDAQNKPSQIQQKSKISKLKKKDVSDEKAILQFFDLFTSDSNNKQLVEDCFLSFLNEHYQVKPVIETALFFPNEDNEKQLINYLKKATKTLDVCVFTITNDNLANQLYISHAKGVKVRIISDDEQAKSLGADISDLAKAGIQVLTDDDAKSHMHHKFIIIDDYVLINGSFNWTRNAVSVNKENLTVLQNDNLVQLYKTEFEKLWTEFKANNVWTGAPEVPQRFKKLKIQ